MPDETLAVPEHRRVRYLRDQRIRQLGYRDYAAYVQSPEWRRVRARFYRTHPAECICGATGRLVLHHKTYDRVGAELDSDLVLLCGECHYMVHEIQERGDAGLDIEAVLDEMRGQSNRELVTALLDDRERDRMATNEAFIAKLQTLPLEQRFRLAQDAALNRNIDATRAAYKARKALETGWPPSVVERWVRLLEKKAFAQEIGDARYKA